VRRTGMAANLTTNVVVTVKVIASGDELALGRNG
jgi:hypothetical protein